MTAIYTTKKLEKIIQKKIQKSEEVPETIFGTWNANVFYVAKKKCLIFVNSKTLFSVIIPRFSLKDLSKIDELFIENFYHQLLFEKINVDAEKLVSSLGDVKFYPTNNNRKVVGIITYNIEKLDEFKYDYPAFNATVIRDMTYKLNNTPFKQLGWQLPCEAMTELLNSEEK